MTPSESAINHYIRWYNQLETPVQKQYALECMKKEWFGSKSDDHWFHKWMLKMEESTNKWNKLIASLRNEKAV